MRHDAAAAIAPRFLPAVAALFWGWQTGLFAIAVPAAVALEARHWTRVRWEVAPIGFQRVADLCTWTFLIVAGYYLLGRGLPVQILPIVQWLPLVLLPLVLVQSFSTAGRIDLAALFVTLRRDRGAEAARRQVDLVLPFVIVCVLAAGAANVRSRAFFAGTAVLALWTLWVLRPRRREVAGWVLAAVLALGMGYAGHLALSRLQGWVFNLAIDYLDADLAR
ncbi:MAG: hypothetical protein IT564_11695, partial [Rhodospirillales bacterium]|nr:hypothetical protein [Rhodospirillales bacterium]